MNASELDQRYYEMIRSGGFSERILAYVRRLIYADFIRTCEPHQQSTILDVGVSDVINNGANAIERLYPYPENVTAAGLGDGAGFMAAYPAIKYVRLEPETQLPFDEGVFDIATSNAVLEHLGSREAQLYFIKELGRVARSVFITVPNMYFPVEHHTGIPLAHFWRPTFATACRVLGKEKWSDERNLILMSVDSLRKLTGPEARIGYTGLRLGQFSSNLFLYFPFKAAPI
jgi:hypothetical protein